ncbi:SDR family oxidoreductase [Halomonas sp. McH1-25]|uniref:SDR family oxidoreductase n=1 Tax=unclassified Halomonas TaxID=2609666 RepID=UPI001EF69FEE|nr:MULTISPECIES: SDR family oxidoreductase [unclassified Halomonas]MCG7599382.1 SDR family oxidoreductase [Halomonas sp. McH1-25]MCP1344108.1 SDR family oxidoreductase [Halomonas sp. FL8]MCP1362643.1 SDR family oxidoreductase [Halomonas sp. BBD45]
MALRLKPLDEQVIVITGATTGIGLATARMAADHGARLVLAARDETALSLLVGECHEAGTEATYVVADVGDEAQVREVAATAIGRFGGFDTWVNNAGVSIYGRMLDIKMEDNRRLMDTNFWGVVHGSLEAARYFTQKPREHGGVIINLGSTVSDRALPIQGMYSASKHAVKGFTDALRMELEEAGEPVAVTLIKPGSIATPYPEHAQNYMAEESTLPPPLYDPRVVAEAILHCAVHPHRDMFVGGGGKMISALGQFAPRLADKIMEATAVKQQKSENSERHQHFGLHTPARGDLRETTSYPSHVSKSSIYTRSSLHPLMTTAIVAGAVLGVAALTGRASPDKFRHR